MGTAKTTFCSNVFILKKHSLKKHFHTYQYAVWKKRAWQTFQCILDSDKFTWLSWKKNCTKMWNTKNISCNHVLFFFCFLRNMSRKTRAYRFLNLPVEEEVSIKAKYSAYYLNKVSKPSRSFKKRATATQLMHEIRYIHTCRLSKVKHLSISTSD